MADEKPGAFTTIQAVSTSATALVVGAAVGTTTPTANSGMAAATITMLSAAAPTVTTNKIYNISGALYFNGLSLATGSSISGTVGTVPKFTGAAALGDSNITIAGSTVTVTGTVVATTNFSGPGALLTGIPTSAVSSGNFVATVASGTGITSSVTSGNAATTTISLNNTAVAPSTYGSSTAIPVFIVDQQGRITSCTTATPQLTLTSTYFSSLAATNLTGSSGITGLGTVTSLTSSGAVTGTAMVVTGASVPTNGIYLSAANSVSVATNGTLRWTFGAGGDLTFNSGLNINSSGFLMTTWGTSGSAANAVVADGDYLKRSTSSLQYKDVDHYLTLKESLAMLKALPGPIAYSAKTDKDKRLYLGFAAEEVAPKAPLLATYDGPDMTGAPNYVTYDRITTVLVPVVQDHETRLAALEAKL